MIKEQASILAGITVTDHELQLIIACAAFFFLGAFVAVVYGRIDVWLFQRKLELRIKKKMQDDLEAKVMNGDEDPPQKADLKEWAALGKFFEEQSKGLTPEQVSQRNKDYFKMRDDLNDQYKKAWKLGYEKVRPEVDRLQSDYAKKWGSLT